MEWFFEPDPITAPGPHRVTLVDDAGQAVAVGNGDDDAAALLDLYTTLRDRGADAHMVTSTARKYALVHRSQRGSEPDWEGEIPQCPECGRRGHEHPAGPCLDRWIHVAFLENPLPEDPNRVPTYSTQLTAKTDEVTEERGWPRNWVATATARGWAVGQKLASPGYARVITEGDTYQLAVCRAATCVPEWGDDRLEVRISLPR